MGKLIRQTAPYIKSGSSTKLKMLHVLIALIIVSIFSVYSFGTDALTVIATSVLTMVGVEFIYTTIKKQKSTIGDLTAIISGIIFALTLPQNASIFSIIICAGLAMFLGKCMFGGTGNNIFNVAAVARVMFAISFVGQVDVDTIGGPTVLAVYQQSGFQGVIDQFTITEMFTGMGLAGALGETSALLLLAVGLYLLVTKVADFRIMLSYIGFSALFAFILSLALGVDSLNYVLFQLFSGGLLFGAVFMATDPVTAPVLNPAKIYYGFGLAALTMLIRVFASLPEGVVFSILLMNMLVPALEYQQYASTKFTKRSLLIFAIVIILVSLIFAVGV